MENIWQIVTVFHYTPVNAKQFDGLSIDGLAGKSQKRQNFPLSIFCTIRYVICENTITKILFACLMSNNAYVTVKISYREVFCIYGKRIIGNKNG